jgi:hypothetical protein
MCGLEQCRRLIGDTLSLSLEYRISGDAGVCGAGSNPAEDVSLRSSECKRDHMTEKRLSGASTPSRILSALRELIRALDRRVPHPERAGEIRIAGDAQILRREAVARIEELQRAGLDDNLYDEELVEAIMTDDGAPAQSVGGHAGATQRSDRTCSRNGHSHGYGLCPLRMGG